jgi:hypothetical protein
MDSILNEGIRAYCLDYNWGKKGPAKPGMYTKVKPTEFLEWHKRMNVNVIQTFCVSLNGYAWYESDLVPMQPGLKTDFLSEVVKLGHANGMKVMGYFCFGTNRRWGDENPEYSYETGKYHLPYTDKYLAYLTSVVKEVIEKTGVDGFMIDWFWQPSRTRWKKMSIGVESGNKESDSIDWLDSEKELYKQLMGKPFPGVKALSPSDEIAYSRKALDRAWKAVRKAVKETNPEAVIWLTANEIHHPHVVNSDMYKEVDWLMDEAGSLESLGKIRPMAGKHTQLITCFAEWNGADPAVLAEAAIEKGIGLYGFGKPDGGGMIKLDPLFERQPSMFTGNGKNISILARVYNGASADAFWKDGRFVEPENPLPLGISFFMGLAGMGCRGDLRMGEGDDLLANIISAHGAGAAELNLKAGQKWPKSVTLRFNHGKGKPSDLRQVVLSNGKTTMIGEVSGDRSAFTSPYVKKRFNLGQFFSETFIEQNKVKKAKSLDVRAGDGFVEVDIPSELYGDQPETLVINWRRDRNRINCETYFPKGQ